MKYLFVTELNQVYKSDSITQKEIDECEQGNLSVIEIESERELLLKDKWSDIPDWNNRVEEEMDIFVDSENEVEDD